MKLKDLLHRALPPEPWSEGEKIPWDEPSFSRRMLREHLTQEHGMASRLEGFIDDHVRWMHETLLGGVPTRILDLGCGPGLYCTRLAALGHETVGVDFSPASIAHARESADPATPTTYLECDVRRLDFAALGPPPFGLAVMLFGEANVCRREELLRVLAGLRGALRPGGIVALETQSADVVEILGRRAPRWEAHERGLFSDEPHLLLHESFWCPEARVTTERWHVVDAASGEVTPHAQSTQAHSDEEWLSLLAEAGFTNARLARGSEAPPDSPGLRTVLAAR